MAQHTGFEKISLFFYLFGCDIEFFVNPTQAGRFLGSNELGGRGIMQPNQLEGGWGDTPHPVLIGLKFIGPLLWFDSGKLTDSIFGVGTHSSRPVCKEVQNHERHTKYIRTVST